MKVGPYLRKELEQARHDIVGLCVALAVPFAIVWLYGRIDLGTIDFGHDFRETSPVSLVLGLSVWLSTLTSAATALYRERTAGTLQRLAATPFSPGLLVATKSCVLVLIALAQSVVVWLSARGLVRTELGAAMFLPLCGTLFLLGVATVSLGILLATLLRSATQIANVVTLLTLAVITLSGFFKPTAEPGGLAPIARYLPFTLAYEALRGAIAGAPAPLNAWSILVLETMLFLSTAAWILRWTGRTTRAD